MAPLVQVNDQTEKRIVLVYNSDSGVYQALDFSKLDDIESLLRDGIEVRLTGVNTINVDVTGGNLTVSDTVDVHNHPASPIYVATVSGVSGIFVNNFPSIQNVTGSVTGSMYVTNFPATQNVTGSVTGSMYVTNFPATQNVTGTITGAVSIVNFPAVQNVTGNISIVSDPAQISTVQLGGTSTSAFGRLLVAESEPMVQAYGNRIYDNRVWQRTSYNGNLTNNIRTASGMAIVTNSTGVIAYADLRSRTVLSYQPGISADAKFTAIFDTPKTGILQYVGIINNEEGLAFGYSGLNFGILHRYDGAQELQKLTVTNASSAGTRNATVKLNGYNNTVSITGNTTTGLCKELADYFTGYIDSGTFYKSYQLDNSVYFVRQKSGPALGSYTLSGNGITGSFSTFKAGKNPIEDWYMQTGWNIDKMNGSGISLTNFNPQLMNIYNIKFGWLGSLPIQFNLAKDNGQGFNPIHLIPWSNTIKATRPWVNEPRFPFRIRVEKTLGDTSLDTATVKTSSVCGTTEGKITKFAPPFSISSNLRQIDDGGGSNFSDEIPVLSICAAPINIDLNTLDRRRLLIDSINVASVEIPGGNAAAAYLWKLYLGIPKNLQDGRFTQATNYNLIWKDTSATKLVYDSLFLVQHIITNKSTQNIIIFDDPFPVEYGEVLILTATNIDNGSNGAVLCSINGVEDL